MNAKAFTQTELVCRLMLVGGLSYLVLARAQAETTTSAPLGLVGWWPAEGTARNSVNGVIGTMHPGAGYAAGKVGQAFAFDGATNSYVEVPDAPILHATVAVTIEFCVKRTSLDFSSHTADYVLEKGGDWTGNQVNYGVALHNPAYNYCLHFTFAGGWRGAGSVADTNWHHCAIVARNGDWDPSFYIDGALQPVTFGQGGPVTLYDSNRPLHIGAMLDPVTGWMYYGRELVDELSIYNRALSASEIQAIYNAGSAGKGPVNEWTNPASDKWESPSWSLGKLPASDQTVQIINAGYKAVNVDSTTVANHASSLTVGSLGVGAPTNALSTLLLNYFGLTPPLKVLSSCAIAANGTILNLFSSFEVDGNNGGAFTIDGGTFTQEGGLTVVNAPVFVRSGSLNSTNGNLTLGEVTLGTLSSDGNFNQDGGSIAAQKVTAENGRYTLTSGILYAIGGTELDGFGEFLQSGGTNYGDVTVNAASSSAYAMDGGLLQGNLLTIPGSFYQGGGLVDMQTVDWTGNNGNVLGLGTLRSKLIKIHQNALVAMGQGNIVPGTVEAESLSISNSAHVSVTGYDLFVTNNLDMRGDSSNAPVNLYLIGSAVRVGTFTVHDNSHIDQYGAGSTELSSGLSMEGGQYRFEAGLLEGPYIGIGTNATFTQVFGSTNLVHGILSISGTYDLASGTLVTDGIYLRGTLRLDDSQSFSAILRNNGLIDLGGNLSTQWHDASPGQVRLSTNAVINFTGGPAQLHFASSSAVAWIPDALLVISNWNNSGNVRILFGNDASGLTASQLAQIQFVNPGGLSPGVYPAQLLSTGELVPAGRPTLEVARTGSGLVLTWASNYRLLSATNVAGPYTPVLGASSPWTNFFTQPMEFFRLQSSE